MLKIIHAAFSITRIIQKCLIQIGSKIKLSLLVLKTFATLKLIV